MGKRIRRVHLEEDTGKLVHETIDGEKSSLIDFNRSSVPLMEMVTEPDFHSTEEIVAFLKEVQLVAKYLGVSNADMDKGSMRLEANISLSKDGSLPDYKVEIKNINSFRFLEKAINAELVRQREVLLKGERVLQETRGYDEVKRLTFSQRTKEEAQDYRYFPEPDIPPMRFTREEIEKLKASVKVLPSEERERFLKEYALPQDYVEILVSDAKRSDYFEEAVDLAKTKGISVKIIADMMINKKMDDKFPEPAGLVKKVVELTKVDYADPGEVEKAVVEVVSEQEKAVGDYKNGKGEVVGFLIGMVQKKLSGRGNSQVVREKILDKLQK